MIIWLITSALDLIIIIIYIIYDYMIYLFFADKKLRLPRPSRSCRFIPEDSAAGFDGLSYILCLEYTG